MAAVTTDQLDDLLVGQMFLLTQPFGLVLLNGFLTCLGTTDRAFDGHTLVWPDLIYETNGPDQSNKPAPTSVL